MLQVVLVGRAVIVVHGRFAGKIREGRLPDPVPLRRGGVYHRGTRPLVHHGVGLMEMLQDFGQIPSVDVQGLIQLPVDEILPGIQAKIVFHGPHIYEPHVVIAVRGGQSPGAAAGLHGMQYLYLFLFLYLCQLLPYQLLYGAFELLISHPLPPSRSRP